jgi:hypothetical protein
MNRDVRLAIRKVCLFGTFYLRELLTLLLMTGFTTYCRCRGEPEARTIVVTKQRVPADCHVFNP